jgi:tetratricopeptide (TPR) repeat protein
MAFDMGAMLQDKLNCDPRFIDAAKSDQRQAVEEQLEEERQRGLALDSERQPILQKALSKVSADLQEQIIPIFRHRTVREILWLAYKQPKDKLTGSDFSSILRNEALQVAFQRFHVAQEMGDEEVARLSEEINRNAGFELERQEAKATRKTPAGAMPTQVVATALTELTRVREGAKKLMSDKHYEHALDRYSYGLQGADGLLNSVAPGSLGEVEATVKDLRLAFALNSSLAALKCEKFELARTTAQMAVDACNTNPKAYWRRAEALAGLGEPAEACRDLEHMLTMNIDKATRKQVEEKLKGLQAREAENKSALKATMEKAMAGGVFGGERIEDERSQCSNASTVEFVGTAPPQPSAKARSGGIGAPLTLSKESCKNLLSDLERAYDTPEVQERIGKAAKAADYDMGAKFLRLLASALEPVQEPILEKYGLPTGKAGVHKMTAAIQYYSQGDPAMHKHALYVRRLAYGGELLEGMEED